MRILISDFRNAHWKYPGGILRPEDIFKLSYDTAVDQKKVDPKVWQKIIDKRLSKKK